MEGLAECDVAAARGGTARKAAVAWIEGAPGTTLLHLMRDADPTTPPARARPPRVTLKRQKPISWTSNLGNKVQSGQLERGSGPWAWSPFYAKEFGPHNRQRERRIVVDYRRFNQREERAV